MHVRAHTRRRPVAELVRPEAQAREGGERSVHQRLHEQCPSIPTNQIRREVHLDKPVVLGERCGEGRRPGSTHSILTQVEGPPALIDCNERRDGVDTACPQAVSAEVQTACLELMEDPSSGHGPVRLAC